jgi:transaldolase
VSDSRPALPAPALSALRVKLFADGADVAEIARLAADPVIRGFTTNPTLMRKAGVPDYRAFALAALPLATGRPISFEVCSDEFDEMEAQAHEIASWGDNVFVKIPVTNSAGEFSGPLVRRLAAAGVRVNVTALLTVEQVRRAAECLSPHAASFVSIFAGRIADTGRDPVPVIAEALEVLRPLPLCELIWASPRELLNLFQASDAGCHIVTATSDILAKLPLIGRNLDQFSLETVRMFQRDAAAAGYSIDVVRRVV